MKPKDILKITNGKIKDISTSNIFFKYNKIA